MSSRGWICDKHKATGVETLAKGSSVMRENSFINFTRC